LHASQVAIKHTSNTSKAKAAPASDDVAYTVSLRVHPGGKAAECVVSCS
jgi:hypothetical protein